MALWSMSLLLDILAATMGRRKVSLLMHTCIYISDVLILNSLEVATEVVVHKAC